MYSFKDSLVNFYWTLKFNKLRVLFLTDIMFSQNNVLEIRLSLPQKYSSQRP